MPQGIESVNGSNVTMGCARLVTSLPGGVTLCGRSGEGGGVISYLVDGNSPTIDTNTPDWASQLVTVRKNDGYDDIPFDHVVLTFVFDTAVSLTGIELDLFHCPEWNIGAPVIEVRADNRTSLVFSYANSNFVTGHAPTQSETSCNSLSTVTLSLPENTLTGIF